MKTDKKAKKKSMKLVVGDLDEDSSDEEIAEFIRELSGEYPDDYDVETRRVKQRAG